MDIVEFAEKFLNVELQEWQKNHLRLLDKTCRDANIRVVIPKSAGRHQAYIYMDLIKELIPNGTTNDC